MTKSILIAVACISVTVLSEEMVSETRGESLTLRASNTSFTVPLGTSVTLTTPVSLSDYLLNEGYQIEIFTLDSAPSWTPLVKQQTYPSPEASVDVYTTSLTRPFALPDTYLLPFSAELTVPSLNRTFIVPIGISQQSVSAPALPIHDNPIPSSLTMLVSMIAGVGLVFGFQRWKTQRHS